MDDRKHFFFLNAGHFLDHLFMLIFATVAALVLAKEWGLTYAQLIPYATPGLIAFGNTKNRQRMPSNSLPRI